MSARLDGTMEPSPAARALSAAGLVIGIALAVYAGVAALDDWPQVVVAALGAVLGAGVAVNAIVSRDIDPWRLPPGPSARGAAWAHQATVVAVAGAVAAAGLTENPWWLALFVAAGALWLLTFRQLVAIVAADDPRPPEKRPVETPPPSVYPRAFQAVTLAFAFALLYAAIAADTPWLWRPAIWDDYQAALWLVLLEFSSLPLTLAGLR
ncbi:MAG: hypothetical protein AB7O67_15410 [Vicinamibacterales bacterium]